MLTGDLLSCRCFRMCCELSSISALLSAGACAHGLGDFIAGKHGTPAL